MLVRRALPFSLAILLSACGSGSSGPRSTGGAGSSGAAGGGAGAGAAGTTGAAGAAAGSSGAAGAAAGSNGAAGAGQAGGGVAGSGQAGGGAAGADAGSSTDARADGGAAGTGATDAAPFDASGLPSFLPAGYTGTPFTALHIPGRINACDYDRGGANVAWCHSPGNCAGGTVTGDYPAGAPVYRPPMPANAQLCSGAACADNVGVCRMNPSKPDKINKTDLAPATDTYLCYTQAGTWTKYTVVVEQAGTYAVDGFMAVPQGGAMNISFSGSGNITTGNVTLPVSSPVDVCGGGEYYHCWIPRPNLATVTFPAAGVYLMTLTQTARFNADNFTFTKM